MAIQNKINEIRDNGRAALQRLKTVVRVGRQTGLHSSMHLTGVRVLARELGTGKQNPSVIFKFYAANDPHRAALIAPHSLGAGIPAGIGRDRVCSFYEMNERINRIAASLARRGVGPGSAVLLVLKNRPEFVFVQAAVTRIGAASVAASWRSTAPELEYLVKNSGAVAIVLDIDVADVIKQLQEGPARLPESSLFVVGGEVPGFAKLDDLLQSAASEAPDRSDDGAVVMYTSGTTGKPKGAVRKFQKNALASTLSFIGETPMRAGDVHLVVCPLYHATAFGFLSMSFVLGSTAVVMSEFRPELFLAAVERYRVTTTAVVPTMLHRILELGEETIRRYDTSSLKAIFCGGAPLSASLASDVLDTLGDKLYNFYGATETGVVTVAGPYDLRGSPGTIGRAVPGQEIRIVDPQGNEVPEGEVGELFVRSALLIEGYHGDAEATRRSMMDGYFSVGDLARRDKRGCYFIEGRKRDMIISGGVNVYPAEVEAALEAHPAVAEAAVVGVPDREWGERVRAFVARRSGSENLAEEELRAFCRARLSGPKVPRDFVFLDALPRNPTGKVLKRELREMT